MATSPPAADTTATDQSPGCKSDDEFDFSMSETQLRRGLQALDVHPREILETREGEGSPVGLYDKSAGQENERGAGGLERNLTSASQETDFPERKTTTPCAKKESFASVDTARVCALFEDEAPREEQQKTVVIYGPTNYANRQVVNKLVQSNPSIFTLVVPHTSRKKQQNEINGLDFHFTVRKEMSDQVKKGNFIECVKISSPKMKIRKPSAPRSPSGSSDSSDPTSPASPADDNFVPLNPWRHHVQVPSPLLTPKSRERRRSSTGNSSELYGTSKEAIHKAHLQGKPCIVLSVTYKGAEQLKKAGCEGVYILVDLRGEGGCVADASKDSGVQPDYHITAENTEDAFSELQQCTFQVVSSLPLSPRTKVDVMRDEWENLPTVEMGQKSLDAASPLSKVRVITFADLLVRYQRERISTKHPETKKTTLSKGLHSECNLVLSLSKVPLSDTEQIHIKALQTIYQKLTGSFLNCRRYGTHWQDIGFQGVDPGENLKEVGFFGVMQLVSFLDQNLPLALEIFNYSREGTHQFPFATVSVNLTEVALKSLRGGHLTKLCNKQDQVFVTLNNYHTAMFYRFFCLWKSQTSSQILPVIQGVESYAKKHPKALLAELQAYLQSGKDACEQTGARKISHSLSNPFTPFNRLSEELDQQAQLTNPSS